MLEFSDLAAEALFGFEIDESAKAESAPAIADTLCPKCNGGGKFISYTGRVVGPCFACEGTGLQRHVGIQLADNDCQACLGTGEWRPGRPCFACNSTGKIQKKREENIDVGAIERAFSSARANGIMRPKLRLDTFVFSRAPDHGRNAGSLYVTENDVYLGKITAGQFLPTRECEDETSKRIIAAAANPSESAKAYGLRTGVCSCCGRTLTNGESIKLGIGPICYEKFGW